MNSACSHPLLRQTLGLITCTQDIYMVAKRPATYKDMDLDGHHIRGTPMCQDDTVHAKVHSSLQLLHTQLCYTPTTWPTTAQSTALHPYTTAHCTVARCPTRRRKAKGSSGCRSTLFGTSPTAVNRSLDCRAASLPRPPPPDWV